MLTGCQKMMEKVSAVMDGASGLEMMVIFSWIMGDMIVQSGTDKRDILDTFERMLEQAINMLASNNDRLN